MWVVHQPGACTGGSRPRGSANAASGGGGGRGRGGGNNNAGRGGNTSDRKAKIAQVLEEHSASFGDDYSAVVDKLSQL